MILDEMIRRREPIPAARRRRDARLRWITIPTLAALKVELYQAIRSARLTKADLARKLKLHPPQIDRLLDLSHSSRLDQLDAAFQALGKAVDVRVSDAA
jgi:antitoxin HicB